MRPIRLLASACLIGAIALPLVARIDKKPLCGLTVILDFKGPHAAVSVAEMERESGLIMKASGVHLDWRLAGDQSPHYDSLVLMTFRGSCGFGPPLRRYYEPGPYASTKITDGEVQPFGDVDCDRVAAAAGDAMAAENTDFFRGDLLVGRALGRVLAHELVHMLTKSNRHGTEGVAKASLSGKELIADSLMLSSPDIERVKKELRDH